MKNTIKRVANYSINTWAIARFSLICGAAGMLVACALPAPPVRAEVYDFGPGAVATPATNRMAPLPPLALAEVEAAAALDSTAVLYRLAYADAQALRPYAQARWSMPPAQLVRQRLREHLGQRRAVLQAVQGVGVAKPGLTLHLELDEFSHWFESPQRSSGLVRMRGTLAHTTGGVERLVAQRSFVMQQPATSADAAGGVRAMAAATDALIQEVDQWVQQVERAQEGK
jgi:cholesterol transport system auxiliary component